MIKVFMTNVENSEVVRKLIAILTDFLGSSKVTFDLEDCDKILRVEAHPFNPNEVIHILNRHGYECQELL